MYNDTLRRLQGLLDYPREGLDVELKGWLDLSSDDDKANLAQAILALANHGGGYILLGFIKADGSWIPNPSRPSDLDNYDQDLINGIVEKYADPTFHCEVHHVADRQDRIFPIVVVPGNHRVPIRAKRDGPDRKHVHQNTYYIRRPGPKSESIQTAQEWDELINRCLISARIDLLDNIRNIVLGMGEAPVSQAPISPEEEAHKRLEDWMKQSRAKWQSLVDQKPKKDDPSRYSHGIWMVGYCIINNFKPPSLSELKEILVKVEGHESGWPPWLNLGHGNLGPYTQEDETLECWLEPTLLSDFWRASPEGLMFLLRRYQEDCEPNRHGETKPGTIFDLTLPIWRVAECLLHSERLATALGAPSSKIIFSFTWEGLRDRTLASWANPLLMLRGDYKSHQGSVTSNIVVSADNINPNLPEIVGSLTKRLYEIFDFYVAPPAMISQEITKMKVTKL